MSTWWEMVGALAAALRWTLLAASLLLLVAPSHALEDKRVYEQNKFGLELDLSALSDLLDGDNNINLQIGNYKKTNICQATINDLAGGSKYSCQLDSVLFHPGLNKFHMKFTIYLKGSNVKYMNIMFYVYHDGSSIVFHKFSTYFVDDLFGNFRNIHDRTRHYISAYVPDNLKDKVNLDVLALSLVAVTGVSGGLYYGIPFVSKFIQDYTNKADSNLLPYFKFYGTDDDGNDSRHSKPVVKKVNRHSNIHHNHDTSKKNWYQGIFTKSTPTARLVPKNLVVKRTYNSQLKNRNMLSILGKASLLLLVVTQRGLLGAGTRILTSSVGPSASSIRSAIGHRLKDSIMLIQSIGNKNDVPVVEMSPHLKTNQNRKTLTSVNDVPGMSQPTTASPTLISSRDASVNDSLKQAKAHVHTSTDTNPPPGKCPVFNRHKAGNNQFKSHLERAQMKTTVISPAAKPLAKPAVIQPKVVTKPLAKPAVIQPKVVTKPLAKPAVIQPKVVTKPMAKPVVIQPVTKPTRLRPIPARPIMKAVTTKPSLINPNGANNENKVAVSSERPLEGAEPSRSSAQSDGKARNNDFKSKPEILRERVAAIANRIVVWNRKQRNYRLSMINKNRNRKNSSLSNSLTVIDTNDAGTTRDHVTNAHGDDDRVVRSSYSTTDEIKNYLALTLKKLALLLKTIARRAEPQPFESLIYHAARNNLTTFKEANRTSDADSAVFITNLLNK